MTNPTISATPLENFSHDFARWAGTGYSFVFAGSSIILWVVIGSFYFPDKDWSAGLIVYIDIIIFLVVFLFQRAMNKDMMVLHIKLNELIATSQEARNNFVAMEKMSEREITEAHQIHVNLAGDTANS